MIENICKMNPYRSSDLITRRFVYETQNEQASPREAGTHAVALVFSGNGSFLHNMQCDVLTTGTLFFIMKKDLFSVTSNDDLKYCYIEFGGRRADEYLDRFGITETNRIFVNCEDMIPFWQESIGYSAQNHNVDLISESVLLYTLAHLTPQEKKHHDVTEQIISLTHDRFADADLSITAIADELGYDAKYLSSLFKKKKGIAYTQYLRELRIRHAVFLIEEGIVSVKNAALLSGFRDALYFSKVFTSMQGITPKLYIQQVADRKNQD